MFYILGWIFYGLLVGMIVRFLVHSDKLPMGILATCGIGIVGSYIGGILNWLIFGSTVFFHPSGILMGIAGGSLLCFCYRIFVVKQIQEGK